VAPTGVLVGVRPGTRTDAHCDVCFDVRARGVTGPVRARLDDEEQAAMDDLLAFMDKIQAMGITANWAELGAAVHVLQGFVIQHMLHRLEPEVWPSWTRNP
jgi:hypothetical protein